MILAKVTGSIRHALEEHRNPLWSGGHSSALVGCRNGDMSMHPGFVDGRYESLQPLLPQSAFLPQEYRPGAVCGTGAADSLAIVHAASWPSAQSQALGEDQRCAGACSAIPDAVRDRHQRLSDFHRQGAGYQLLRLVRGAGNPDRVAEPG